MTKRLFLFLFLSFTGLSVAQDDTEKKVQEPTSLNCALKAKAVQAGSFWGGTYFDTSVTSEKIKALEIHVPLHQLKAGQVEKAQARIKVADQSIVVAKDSDKNALSLSYQITLNSKLRSVSSTQPAEVLPLKAEVQFEDQNFEKQFSMIAGHKAYVHFDVSEPKHFDLKITNVFLICSLK